MKLTGTDLDRRIAEKFANFDPKPIDPAQLIATGSMSGPHFRTHPVTLNFRARLVRWLRNLWSKKL